MRIDDGENPMNDLQIQTNPEVDAVFQSYPSVVRKKMDNLRRLVIEAAKDIDEISILEETLKWGEPSYLVKHGSTVRIDWKKNQPDQYAVYFKCTSRLVSTFKLAYGDKFEFEGNRAIVFHMSDKLPDVELKNCIAAALRYHKVKQLPMLGL